MYDTLLTRISLPTERYRLLLGTALCVFSSNNGLIIENILHTSDFYSWHVLADKESGQLKPYIAKTITEKAGPDIAKKFDEIIAMRNRIIHGFRVTSSDGEQILATKERGESKQFYITKTYILQFIRLNNELSDLLHEYCGH